MNKRVLIASGGTGGHFYPGFALGHKLIKQNREVVFLVRINDMAIKTLEENNMVYADINILPMPRSLNPLSWLVFAVNLVISFFQTIRILKDYKPDIVVGMGGYTSFPAIIAAKFLRIPSVIHESNAKYGLANYLCAFFTDKVALGLPLKDNHFKDKSALTGTPIRESFRELPSSITARKEQNLKPDKTTLLIFGGSQGARKINHAAINAINKLKNKLDKFQVLHITGKKNFEEIKNEYEKNGISLNQNIKLLDYTEDMHKIYAAADIVVSRSGASTISELLYLKKPSILVPLPSSAGGHQKENAKVISETGAAVLLEETDNFGKDFLKQIEEIIDNPELINKMKLSYDKTNIPDIINASSALANLTESIISNSHSRP